MHQCPFNAYTASIYDPRGSRSIRCSRQGKLAEAVSNAIATAGEFIDRGAKKRTDLHFLNDCAMPAILLEVCFVDSEADCDLYRTNFKEICMTIADLTGEITDEDLEDNIEEPVPPQSNTVVRKFGSLAGLVDPMIQGYPKTKGWRPVYDVMDAPHRFHHQHQPGRHKRAGSAT